MITYKERLNHITTLIFDVDGVLTTGDITIGHDEIYRTLNAKDGYALQLAAKMGLNLFVISGGHSEALKKSLTGLGFKDVFMSIHSKMETYQSIKKEHGLEDSEILYMGDDIPDYKIMQQVGCAVCPQDAVVEIKSIAHYQSPFNGGKLAVRDVVEQVLRVQNKWMTSEAFSW